MNRRTLRKYASIYLKQGLLALLLFLFTVCLGLASSWKHTLFPTKVSRISQLSEESFADRNPIVQISCDTLYYTGYDNRRDETSTGRYYYTIEEDCLLYILLDDEASGSLDVIQNYTGTVRLIQDRNLYHALTTQMASELDWSSDSLRELSIPAIASQPDYHLATAIIFVIGLSACGIIFFASFLINMMHYRHCRLQSRRRPHRTADSEYDR